MNYIRAAQPYTGRLDHPSQCDSGVGCRIVQGICRLTGLHAHARVYKGINPHSPYINLHPTPSDRPRHNGWPV